MSNEVTLPRSVVVIGALLVGLSAISVAFLMGRNSATRPVAPASSAVVATTPTPEAYVQKRYSAVPSPDERNTAATSPARRPAVAAATPAPAPRAERDPEDAVTTRRAERDPEDAVTTRRADTDSEPAGAPGGGSDRRPAAPAPPGQGAAAPPPPARSPHHASAAAPSSPRVDPAQRKEVIAYFSRMDKAMAEARQWDNADSVTQAAVLTATRRDPRQLKAIIDANHRALEDVRAIVPPAACVAHHQMAQKMLVNASRIVQNVASSTIAGNMDDLGDDLAPAAEALRRDAATLRDLRAEVCRQYGINLPSGPARNS